MERIFRFDCDVSLLPFVRTVDEYVNRTIQLVQDSLKREICGTAERDFYQGFLQDSAKFSHSTCYHLVDTAKQARPHVS